MPAEYRTGEYHDDEALVLHGAEGRTYRLESPPNFGSFNLHLPYSDLRSEWVMEDDLLDQFRQTSTMSRLAGIPSLSLLSFHGPSPTSEYMGTAKHSRETHSYGVAMVIGKIGDNNDLPENVIIPIVIAGVLHDSGMPPYGDAVTNIDRANLNEETNYHDTLDKRVRKILDEHGVTLPQLDQLIGNNGLGGKILDIADRITYVMQDLTTLAAGPTNYEEVIDYLDELDFLVIQNRDLGNIYKDVKIDSDSQEPYFEDPARLGVFLKVRALLHERFYMHPISQGRDMLFGNIVSRYYSPTGEPGKPLTPTLLRQLSNRDLDDILTKLIEAEITAEKGEDAAHDLLNIGRHTSVAPAIHEIAFRFTPQNVRLTSQWEAEYFASLLSDNPDYYIIGIKQAKGFKTATEYLTKSADGQILPFYEAYPEKAAEINEIARSMSGHYVHFTQIPDSNLGDLLSFFKEKDSQTQ